MKTNFPAVKELDVIVPIALELDWPTVESTVRDILEQVETYGLKKFALACPGGGWRSTGYPEKEVFERLAEMFAAVKQRLVPYGVELGWWNTLTIKSGRSADFSGIVRVDGQKHPFANCPLDENFKRRFSQDNALFAKIAEPSFIIFEDDYSLRAAAGCYCEKHLAAFAKRQGKYYTREELVELENQKTPEALAVLQAWRGLLKDSLAELADCVRKELDKCTPQIPAGIMQTGAADLDGNSTEAIARALAGENHTPFCRFFGAFYHSYSSKDIPHVLFHSLYNKQHITGDFTFYHETDTYPHTKFYTAAAHTNAIMATVYSYGFDGSTFQTQQLLDCPNEESAYGKQFAAERNRYNAVYRIAGQCRLNGAQLEYDPFFNTLPNDAAEAEPLWLNTLSRFGIPYTSTQSDVVFWDLRQAKYADHGRILQVLSKTLFLDGDAAGYLCERGYGEYLGVQIGACVTEDGDLSYDLAAREIICDAFVQEGKGRHMPSAHMYNPLGTGRMLAVIPADNACEIVTEYYDMSRRRIAASMTRYQNSLGGKVVVMGLTLDGNRSHALYNYRRKRLLTDLLIWAGCDFAFVKEAPEVFLIENRPKDAAAGFKGMLTLINYCEDTLDEVTLYLPESLQNTDDILVLAENGQWQKAVYEKTADGVLIKETLRHLSPVYLLIT